MSGEILQVLLTTRSSSWLSSCRRSRVTFAENTESDYRDDVDGGAVDHHVHDDDSDSERSNSNVTSISSIASAVAREQNAVLRVKKLLTHARDVPRPDAVLLLIM